MEKQEIQNRSDVEYLVRTFYGKIRRDEVLGPIFNGIIENWEEHFKILIDFWESQIFLKRTYQGNPVTVHQKVDGQMNNSITSEHFGRWLNIWFATLDELFIGETAWIAKNRAQKMSTMLFMQIFTHRKKGTKN